MEWILGIYGILFIIFVILALGSWLIWDQRFNTKHGQQVPSGFKRTNEISIDPTTKKKLVVYYNPETGERFYKED